LDGDLFLAISVPTGSGVLKYNRPAGWTTLALGGLNNAATMDRSPGNGMLTVFPYGALQRMDLTGRIISTRPLLLQYILMGACHQQERNLATARQGRPNDWLFHLSFPGEGGRSFILGLSLGGFTPGIALGVRQIGVVPDPLLTLSVNGRLASVFTHNVGALSPRGESVARLNLKAFGKTLSGTRIWAAAITLDPQAPFGIATISKPVVLVLD